MEKIFCIGFPKTGTTSLEKALEILGFNVCRGHYNNNHTNYLIGLFLNKDYAEIEKIIDYFDVFADLPWGGTDFYRYLANKYPNAKFIHTQREVDEWYISLEKMLTKFDSNLETALNTFHKMGRYGAVYYFKKEFNTETLNNKKEVFIERYNKTNDDIRIFFNATNISYLSINIIQGEGWEKLCSFLNKEIPEVNFPHSNKGKEVNNLIAPSNSYKNTLFLKIKKLFFRY
ncbi:MAG: hypothetical protein HKP31_01530 [Nitrosopumilus sp.]|nr:hypothetical protein [Nitrosopumilus sp.]